MVRVERPPDPGCTPSASDFSLLRGDCPGITMLKKFDKKDEESGEVASAEGPSPGFPPGLGPS